MERLISEGDYNQNRKSGSKQDIAVLMKLRFTFTKCLTKLQNVIINRIQRRGGGGGGIIGPGEGVISGGGLQPEVFFCL